ncbi:MAG: hypothetical protein EZS28_001773 [Streblomastix strix]|uniref:SPRY domain-containing protein n=1 Tax=Streblomastix strix TaxID=222440 RepID=A0A5J4X736_9EUKA|nr:MAG: hypothetical protein EZS28_001773 [Streblomastix strix]
MEESSERTNRNSAITSTTNDNGIANIPQLANDLRSTDVFLHYPALQRLFIAIVMDSSNIEAVKQQDMVGVLNNFLVSEARPELQELSVAILGVLGAHGKRRRKRSRALTSGWALIQIILNSDQVLSKQGTEALCKLIVIDEDVRHAMLSRRFVDLILETFINQEKIQNQSSSFSSDQQDESEQNFVKVGLLSVVLKLAEEIENPIILSALIPTLEEIKKNGEKEMMKKAKSILGCLREEGITAPQSNESNQKDEKIRQLEETVRRQEELIRRNDEEKEREKIEKEENKRKIAELERKAEESKQKDEVKSNKIVELEQLVATLQQKVDKVQIPSAQKLDEIPIQITVQPGSYTKEKNEFTYISTKNEFKTFPISPAVINGIFICEVKINKKGDNPVGVMKSGLVVPFSEWPGDRPYSNECIAFHQNGPVYQNSQTVRGNGEYGEGDQVTIEVNLLATPRTAHLFINGQQQPVFVSGLPKSVQFWMNPLQFCH